MKNILFLFLFFIAQFYFSQDGYQVKINLKNVNEKNIYLSVYGGSINKTFAIDSATISDKKEVNFTQKKRIIGAIYRLSFKKNDKTNFANIDIENGSKLIFSLENNVLLSLKTNDLLNKSFLSIQNVSNKEERKSYLDALVKKFPKSVAALYANLELKELNIPKEESQLKNYRNQFFKGIDLNDKRIKLLPNIYSTLFSFMKILPINNENYKSNVDVLLKNQNCKTQNFLLYLKWIFMNLEYLSKNNLDETYNYVFNTYLNTEDCIKADEKYYKFISENLKLNEKLPLGSLVPNILMSDLDNSDVNLNSIYPSHDYTLMIFFDPDCSHCQEKIPEIQKFFKENNFSKDVRVVAFLNVPTDEHWKKFVEDYQMKNWLNVKSKENSTKYQQDLGIFGNPDYILLNRKGEVVLKNYHPDEFRNLFY